MKGNDKVLAYLNEVLGAELTAIDQYLLHAGMLKIWGHRKLYDTVHAQSLQAVRHVEILLARLLSLGGMPAIRETLPLRIGATVKEQFQNDLALVREALPRLHDALEAAIETGDSESHDSFDRILADAEDHVDWLEAQLYTIRELGSENYRLGAR